jgi:LPS export ABC transporter protein LptC
MTKLFRRHKTLVQAALFSSCLLFLACENDDDVISEWTQKVVLTEEAKKVEAYLSQGGRMCARLQAPVMVRQESDTLYTEFPKTLHVDFYDSTGVRESWLDSRYGKHFENLNKVLLRDSVRVISAKGDTLSTSELWWDQNTRKFYTDKQVRIATKSKLIYGGKGMDADQDLDNVTIHKPTGTVLVNDNFESSAPPAADSTQKPVEN